MKEPGIYRKATSGFSMLNDRPISTIWLTKSYLIIWYIYCYTRRIKSVIGFVNKIYSTVFVPNKAKHINIPFPIFLTLKTSNVRYLPLHFTDVSPSEAKVGTGCINSSSVRLCAEGTSFFPSSGLNTMPPISLIDNLSTIWKYNFLQHRHL